MTVESTDRKVALATNGSVKTFPFDFKVIDEDHIEVYLDDTEVTTGFTITINEAGTSGSVVFTTAPATGQTLTILRVVPVDRQVDYAPNADLRSTTLNNDLDKGIMISQQLADDIRKCVKFGFNSTMVDCVIDDPVTDRMLAWDSSGNLVNVINPLPGTAAYVVQAASYASNSASSASESAASAVDSATSALQSASYASSSASYAGAAEAAVSNIISQNRNKILNGSMRWWQRGTSFAASGTSDYTADRFRLGASLLCARSTDVPEDSGLSYSLSVTPESGTPHLTIYHGVELPATGQAGEFYVGSTWTLSCWMKCDAAKTVEFYSSFKNSTLYTDTTDRVDAGINEEELVTLSPNVWTYVTLTGTITGTAHANNTAFVFYFRIARDTSTTPNLKLTGVQLEKGSIATPFEHLNPFYELSLLQRYYEVIAVGSYDHGQLRYAGSGVANYSAGGGLFMTTKRIAPTMTITGTPAYTNCSNLATAASTTGFRCSVTSTGAGAYMATTYGLTAAAEL